MELNDVTNENESKHINLINNLLKAEEKCIHNKIMSEDMLSLVKVVIHLHI